MGPRSSATRAATALVCIVMTSLIVVAPGCGSSHPSKTPPAARPRPAAPEAARLQACLNGWNSPANATQQRRFAAMVNAAASGTVVLDKALVTTYGGAALYDVGVGVAGVNLAAGDCVVVHPANVIYALTDNAWHRIGYAPGKRDLAALPKRAARSPNAHLDLASGTLSLTGP